MSNLEVFSRSGLQNTFFAICVDDYVIGVLKPKKLDALAIEISDHGRHAHSLTI
jgi:hypothetical protein